MKTSISANSMSAEPGLSCEYITESVEQLLDSENVLAVFGFDEDSSGEGKVYADNPRYIDTGLTQIAGRGLREVWYSSTPVSSGVDQGVRWASNDSMLLLSMAVDESESKDLHEATYKAYKRLLGIITERGCPHIVRAWNYLADINAGEGDSERYKRFCSGRHEAFVEHDHCVSQFPAACALGHHGGPLVIYLLASSEPACHFENPQQVSAYHYPREYGVRSPSFARAALKSWLGCDHIYISGTASIVGHRSLHRGDVARQLEVTFDNIDRLLKHVQTGAGLAQQPQMSLLKVYVRDSQALDLIRSAVEREYGSAVQVVYVLADICRQELEVEIDGMCALPSVDV